MLDSLLKIVKESGINFFGTFFGKIIAYVGLIIITRFLTPGEFGTFTLAKSVINISLIFVLFGTPKALDRFIPFYNAVGEFGKTKKLIRNILTITLILSIIVGIILFFSSNILSNRIFKNSDLSYVLKIMVLSIPLLTFISIVSWSFIGFKELRYRIYLEKLSLPILKIIFATLILFLGFGLLEWTWMYLLILFSVALLALVFFKKKIISPISEVQEQSISFKRIFDYSWPLSINTIILLLLVQVNFIILGILRPSSEIGVYRIYLSLIEFVILGMGSLATIYKPAFTEYIAKQDLSELKNIYKRISKWFIAITFLGSIIVIFLGKNLVSVFFTEKYLIAPLALIILAGCQLIRSLAGPDFMTLEAFGNTKLLMINSIVMLFANVGLAYLLIPTYGITGAAVAITSATVISHLLGLLEVYKLHNLQPFDLNTFRYIIALGITGIVFYLLKLIIPYNNILSILVLLLILVIVYFLSVYFIGGFDSTDLEILRYIKRKIISNGV